MSSYRILSFCGGGIRGLLSSGLLHRLAESCPRLVPDTDQLAGTSTGADIIRSILAHLPTSAIYNGYKRRKCSMTPDWRMTGRHTTSTNWSRSSARCIP